MQTIDINCELRENTGKNASKTLRKEKKVPCVLYGGKENVHFTALHKDFEKIVFTPNVYIVNLHIGDTSYKGVMKALQFHPVTDNIQHIDFKEIVEGHQVVIDVPTKLHGLPKGVTQGGKLQHGKHYVKVKGFVDDIPDHLDIDVSKLAVGEAIKIEDLSYDKIELVDPATQQVAVVKSTRSMGGILPEEEEGEEGEEDEEGEESEEGEGNEEGEEKES